MALLKGVVRQNKGLTVYAYELKIHGPNGIGSDNELNMVRFIPSRITGVCRITGVRTMINWTKATTLG